MADTSDSPLHVKHSFRQGGASRIFLAFLAAVAALAGAEFYALWQSYHSHAPATAAVQQKVAAASTEIPRQPLVSPEIVGWVDEPIRETVVGDLFKTNGWALAKAGIRDVGLRVDGRSYPARYGLPRPDVAAQKPGFPDGAASGFSFEGTLADLTPVRHEIEYVATDKHGNTKSFGRKSLVPPAALAMWRPQLDVHPALARNRFHFLMMASAVGFGSAAEADSQYKEYVSRTQKVGVSVPILYLRTTTGASGDWQFDPEFDLSRKCGNRLVAEDNLAGVMRFAIKQQIPVQFILNGGIWSDASCETPQWDLTDHLEEDPANCQWTQSDQVYPDNYLKGRAGSTDSPELARSLTYNVYATKVRAYKKRNLQAAAKIIAEFGRMNPDLLVGVALDSDTYMNPFFFQKEIFDYNPGMLRQFREWLLGSGPYAGKPSHGVPDLTRYRRAHPFTLAQVNALARANWKSWDEVQPPRHLPGSPRDPLQSGETPFWADPWWQAWDAFRKHIVGLHYDELSTWAREMGIPRDKIFSAQGFIRPDPGLAPFAIHIESHTQNYDSAGVSVEGAIPRDGHLGVVVYGDAARNDVPMEDRHSLFATFGRRDNGWAIVEYNSTDLKRPDVSPPYGYAYRTFRDAFNLGAREVSAMAWNGSNGLNAGQPGYLHYTAWRNTEPEQAMLDFLVSHADVPRGARLWTFGSPRHTDDDGWTVARGSIVAGAGSVTLEPDSGVVTLVSPPDQIVRPEQIESLILRWEGKVRPSRVTIAAQIEPDSEWREIASSAGPHLTLAWPAPWRNGRTIVERLKLELTFPQDAKQATLSRVLLYPR